MAGPRSSESSLIPIECSRCAARHIGLFADITGPERDRLLERLRHVRGPAGTVLYSEGYTGHDLYIIRAGFVKLLKYAPNGAPRIVRIARPGDVIGLGIIIRDEHGHTAQSMTEIHACRVPVDLVSHDAHRIEGLERKLFGQWQSALEAADAFLTDLSTGTAHARVARLLLYLAKASDEEECPNISREEMGALLGITTETASRVMAEFKRAGIVAETKDAMRCDAHRLEEQANA